MSDEDGNGAGGESHSSVCPTTINNHLHVVTEASTPTESTSHKNESSCGKSEFSNKVSSAAGFHPCIAKSLASPPPRRQTGSTKETGGKRQQEQPQRGMVDSRRFPGRPRKHHRPQPFKPAAQASRDDQDLRSFFEMGGRDYSHFLEWKRQKRKYCTGERVGDRSIEPELKISISKVEGSTPSRPKRSLPSDIATTSNTKQSPPQLITLGPRLQCPPYSAPVQRHYYLSSESLPSPVEQKSPPTELPEQSSVNIDNDLLDLSQPHLSNKTPSPTNGLPSPLSVPHPYPYTTARHHHSYTAQVYRNHGEMYSVDDVVSFVASVTGTTEYEELLRLHCIDGSVILSISDEHFLNVLHLKLGHMYKLKAAISNIVYKHDSTA